MNRVYQITIKGYIIADVDFEGHPLDWMADQLLDDMEGIDVDIRNMVVEPEEVSGE